MPRKTMRPPASAKPDARKGRPQVMLDTDMAIDAAMLRRLKLGETTKDLVRVALRFTAEVAGECAKGASLHFVRPGESPERLRILAGRAVL